MLGLACSYGWSCCLAPLLCRVCQPVWPAPACHQLYQCSFLWPASCLLPEAVGMSLPACCCRDLPVRRSSPVYDGGRGRYVLPTAACTPVAAPCTCVAVGAVFHITSKHRSGGAMKLHVSQQQGLVFVHIMTPLPSLAIDLACRAAATYLDCSPCAAGPSHGPAPLAGAHVQVLLLPAVCGPNISSAAVGLMPRA